MQSLSSKKHTPEGHVFILNFSSFDLNFRYGARAWDKTIYFLDNWTWTECGKFFLLWREYLSSAVIVVANTTRISDTLRWTFSNPESAKLMKQYDGSAVVLSSRLLNMLTVARCSETRLFRHLTNHTFPSLYFREYITHQGHLFFQNVQHLI